MHYVQHDTNAAPVAQGDIQIKAVAELPKDVEASVAEGGQYIVAHSETGHNHVIEATPDVKFYQSKDPLLSYLEVEREAVLTHMRSYDTHAPFKFSKGVYEIRRQVESVPEGLRRVVD